MIMLSVINKLIYQPVESNYNKLSVINRTIIDSNQGFPHIKNIKSNK